MTKHSPKVYLLETLLYTCRKRGRSVVPSK